MRLIFGNRVSLHTTTREYFVSRIGGGDRTGHDDIISVAFTIRVNRQHAVAVRYLLARRVTYSTDLGDRSQSSATIRLFYTYLGNDGFGVVDWRDANTR